ncbi:transcription termination/antitermination NusG family protein, partial [Rhizobium ruizarguesonis]
MLADLEGNVGLRPLDTFLELIKNTPKVTGFLGSDNKHVPIPDYEAERILGQVQE